MGSTNTYVRVGEHAFVGTVAVVALAPFYVMLSVSMQRPTALLRSLPLVPNELSLTNYIEAWNDLGFDAMFRNSVILTLGSTLLAVVVATAAAFGLSRFDFAGRKLTLVVVAGSMAVPPIVIILPVFLLMSQWGWVNTYPSAILVEAGLLFPFATFVMYGFMRDHPKELYEAASIDGAGSVQQFLHVAIPISGPALVTTFLISAIFAWNDLLVPLILWQTQRLQTLMVGLATLGPGRTGLRSVPLLMAGVVISVAPLIVLFVLTRRLLVKGLTEGAVK